jgi:hypothetical protein
MMMQMLKKEEADATADQQQVLLLLTNLLRLRQQILVGPRRGGSRVVGKAKNKDRHPLVSVVLVDSDYFNEDAGHTAKDFRR